CFDTEDHRSSLCVVLGVVQTQSADDTCLSACHVCKTNLTCLSPPYLCQARSLPPLTHSYLHAHNLTYTHIYKYTHTLTHTLLLTSTHAHNLTYTHIYRYTHTHTQSHTLTYIHNDTTHSNIFN